MAFPRASAAPGRAVADRVRMTEIQRGRIVTATVELVRERGIAAMTVAHIVGCSGVSRRTFYELFEDREECLLAMFEYALERARAAVLPVYRAAAVEVLGPGDLWEEQIRAGLAALLEFLDAEPALGGLCIIDALAADRTVLELRAQAVEALVDAVHRGGARRSGERGRRPARLVAEGAVGAVLAVIHARLCERDPKRLAGLLNQLMGMIVLPYRGPDAAARELRRRAPRARRGVPAPAADPLRELDMRLTYRTIRVLFALAELGGRGPGPSSRAVADASGISDQGQISKLLWRLEHLGLIANGVAGHRRGESNAWSLTPTGHEAERALRSQAGR
jgi:AcrR family transcriptional regulator